ncbi:MAG TPA: hypothetical protein VNN25_20250, partial [Thermoanaerobaculia bacterium]|nr:hypothetical protein [Thermoanaerobaculia bacterium]
MDENQIPATGERDEESTIGNNESAPPRIAHSDPRLPTPDPRTPSHPPHPTPHPRKLALLAFTLALIVRLLNAPYIFE